MEKSYLSSFTFVYIFKIIIIVCAANPLGIVVAQVVSPFIITGAADVPTNNYIWMAGSGVMLVATVLFVRS